MWTQKPMSSYSARPVGAEAVVAGRPRLAVVGRLEEAVALDDRPEALRLVGVRDDRRDAEMARRLLARVVPVLAASCSGVARSFHVCAAVAALEDPGHLRAGQQPSVRRRQARDLRHLELAVVAVAEALARLRPRLAEIGAAPDGGAVPLARGGRVDPAARRGRRRRGRPASPRRTGRARPSRAGRRRSRARSSPCASPPAASPSTSSSPPVRRLQSIRPNWRPKSHRSAGNTSSSP